MTLLDSMVSSGMPRNAAVKFPNRHCDGSQVGGTLVDSVSVLNAVSSSHRNGPASHTQARMRIACAMSDPGRGRPGRKLKIRLVIVHPPLLKLELQAGHADDDDHQEERDG